MADTRIVAGKGIFRSGGGGGGDECKDQGSCRVPFKETTTTLYVRPHGEDRRGHGTQDRPFRTFQFAICQVPSILQPGATYIIDITGITETLPSNYQLPTIQSTIIGGGVGTTTPPSAPYYLFQTGVTIRALPQLTTLLSSADATISAADAAVVSSDPVSNLVTLTITSPRAAWAGNVLKGKQLVRTVKSSTSANATCVIYGSDSTHLFLCNDANSLNGGNGPLVLASGEVLQIVEPSAMLIGSTPTGGNQWGISCWGINNITLQGIHFVAPAGLYALAIGNADVPTTELCVIDGLLTENTPNGFEFLSTTFTTSYDLEPVPGLATRSLFMNFDLPQSYVYIAAFLQTFNDVVFDDTFPTLTSGVFFVAVGSNWGLANVLFQGSTGDAIHANYGTWILTNVSINNAAGNAITVDTGPVVVQLTNVGGSGNAGFGIAATNGVQVSADSSTTVTGSAGDIQSGSLGPLSYAAIAPGVNGGFDIPPNSAIGVATGTRVYGT